MIEVNLYSIPAGEVTARVGKCIARNRFDRDAMGTTPEEFLKGFLRNNFDKIEGGLNAVNDQLIDAINSNKVLSRRDLSCINHYLIQSGYMFQIINVADDEENPVGVPSGEVSEWNVIDKNFIQNDYPTATKIIPGDKDHAQILKQVVEQSGLFDKDKFSGLKNPFTELLNNLEMIKKESGQINANIVTKIYALLDECGIEIFCAVSED